MPALSNTSNLDERLSVDDIIKIEEEYNLLENISERFECDNDFKLYRNQYCNKCQGGYSRAHVDPRGNVSICAIYRAEKYYIFSEEISFIWQRLNLIHESLKNIYYDSKCGECQYSLICRACPAYSYLEPGNHPNNDYLCKLTQKRIEKCNRGK
jgi:radical SAM protein with 4Fe4S-binding SPASM domain